MKCLKIIFVKGVNMLKGLARRVLNFVLDVIFEAIFFNWW